MEKIIGSNMCGQIVVKQFGSIKDESESYQEFLDRVNNSIEFDPQDKDAFLSLDFSDWGFYAFEELKKADYREAGDILKDYNTIIVLKFMAEEKKDKNLVNKIINIMGVKVLEPIKKLRTLLNVPLLYKIKLNDLFDKLQIVL